MELACAVFKSNVLLIGATGRCISSMAVICAFLLVFRYRCRCRFLFWSVSSGQRRGAGNELIAFNKIRTSLSLGALCRRNVCGLT